MKFVGMLCLAICVAVFGKILLREYIKHETGSGAVVGARVLETGEIVSMREYYEKKYSESCKDTSEFCAAFIDEAKQDCNASIAEACGIVGGYYDKNRDYEDARLYYEKACSLLHSYCTSLGILYVYGIAVKQDYKKAAEYFLKACDSGNAPGCSNLGVMYRTGEGVRIDLQKAAEYYKKSCDLSFISGCISLGNLYDGEKLHNTKKAMEYYGKACDLGDQEGCDSYKKLYLQSQ